MTKSQPLVLVEQTSDKEQHMGQVKSFAFNKALLHASLSLAANMASALVGQHSSLETGSYCCCFLFLSMKTPDFYSINKL